MTVTTFIWRFWFCEGCSDGCGGFIQAVVMYKMCFYESCDSTKALVYRGIGFIKVVVLQISVFQPFLNQVSLFC